MNRKEVRVSEFAMHREWAERFTSEKLRQMLADDELHSGKATAAKEVLRSRGEASGNDPFANIRSPWERLEMDRSDNEKSSLTDGH